MTREQKRAAVVEACIAHQRQVADTAKQEMESAQQQSNDYGANVDRYDSYRTKMLRARDMYARQYSNAEAGIRYLEEMLRKPPFDIAEHGAIVETNSSRFFLSVGVGKFLVPFVPQQGVRQEVFFAISAQSPIYAAIKGHRVGESFVFNGIRHTVQQVY
ncbi:MAG: hypothetical protein IJU81_08070 [Bacteroidales bacterium]|nr:hypothetical protein [Bacteroidales bacterium]